MRSAGGARLRAADIGRRGDPGDRALCHEVLRLQRQALPREAGERAWLPAELWLDQAGAAGCRPGEAGQEARGASAQAAAQTLAGHDAAPGRFKPPLGPGRRVGSDRDDGRCHQRDLLGLLRRGGRHDVDLPGVGRGDRQAGPVRGALCRSRLPLLDHEDGRSGCRRGDADPGQAGARPARHHAHPGLGAGGARPLGAHVRHAAGAAAAGAAGRGHHHHGSSQSVSKRGLPARPQRRLPGAPGRGGQRLHSLHRTRSGAHSP